MTRKPSVRTFGELKKSGYKTKTVKDELRENLLAHLREGKSYLDGIVGYENSVVPDLERAILAKHNINLLGLRGQAKTRIARQIVNLLDEWIPVVDGSEMNDDPFYPVSTFAKQLVKEKGDETPIQWLHRSERYVEKLATPDVSVADLIGDLDPIKAANLKLSFAHEQVIHYGIIPRSNRCIFVINELPDLSPRMQVALFNLLQEGDIQIRGFKFRLKLDIQFIFTANPEDYTSRATIITPLKDRIGAQILTHYPKTIQYAKQITLQEAQLSKVQIKNVKVHDILATLVELVVIESRRSELVDNKSGVSARLSISIYEMLVSAAERRMILNGEKNTFARISDLFSTVAAINGKIELGYEGQQKGMYNVALTLICKAIRTHFAELFCFTLHHNGSENSLLPHQVVVDWFNKNNCLVIPHILPQHEYERRLNSVPGLDEFIINYSPEVDQEELLLMKEFVLHGLAEQSIISKKVIDEEVQFFDTLSNVFSAEKIFIDQKQPY